MYSACTLHGLRRLRHGAGEAVEDEAVGAVGRLDVVLDDADDEIVRDQAATLHHGLCLLAQLRALGDGRAQQVARGQVAQAVLLLDDGRLSRATTHGAKSRCAAARQGVGCRGGAPWEAEAGGGPHLRALAAAGRADEDDVLARRHLHPTLELGQQVQRVHTLPRRRAELAHTFLQGTGAGCAVSALA